MGKIEILFGIHKLKAFKWYIHINKVTYFPCKFNFHKEYIFSNFNVLKINKVESRLGVRDFLQLSFYSQA